MQRFNRQTGIYKAGKLIFGNNLVCFSFFTNFFLLLHFAVGYIPQDMFDAGGANTKQVSRTLEVCTLFLDLIFGTKNT